MQGERQKRAADAAETMTNKTDKNSNETRSWAEAPSKIEQLSKNTNHHTDDECYLFGMHPLELERFNFIAGVILFLVAWLWIGAEMFTVRPAFHSAVERLVSPRANPQDIRPTQQL